MLLLPGLSLELAVRQSGPTKASTQCKTELLTVRESSQWLFAKSLQPFMCLALRRGFCRATQPYCPDWWGAAAMVDLLDLSPVSTQDLWSSARVIFGFLVTSLTKALLPQLFSLAGRPALGRRVLVDPNDGGHCALRNNTCSRFFL